MNRTKSSVGIFWIECSYGKTGRVKIFADKIKLENAELYGNHRVHPLGHFQLWSGMQDKNPRFKNKHYEDIPRGRVVWLNGIFYIYANEIAKDGRIQKAILREFAIKGNFRFDYTDAHYRL